MTHLVTPKKNVQEGIWKEFAALAQGGVKLQELKP